MENEIKYSKELSNKAAVVVIDGVVVKNRYETFITLGRVEEMKRRRENIVIQEGDIVQCYFEDSRKYKVIDAISRELENYSNKIIFY